MSSSIDKLKEQNRQELDRLDEPYQLKTYAIPEKHWKTFLGLMQSNLPLLPKIAEEMRYNSSEHTLNQSTQAIQSTLADLSSQAGRNHDESSKRLRGLEKSLTESLERSLENRLFLLWKKIKTWLLTGFISLGILLGLLVILAR